MSENKVRVGIAGLGRSGWNIHAKLLGTVTDVFKIVAVLDADAKRLEEAKKDFGCKTYTDFASMLADKDVELVINAMPSHFHAPLTIQALGAGKHVVCEKPMATCAADADKMIAAARKSGKRLTIFQNYRYQPHYQKVREVIASGKLGRIVQIKITVHGFSRRWDWQTLQEFGGGSLNNTGPHFLDMALQLMGDKDPQVFCNLERVLTSGDADDHVKVILRAKDAPMVDLEISSACCYPQEMWLVMGTCGGLAGKPNALRWKYFDPKALPPRPIDRKPTPDRSYNTETYPWQPEETWEAAKWKGPGQEQFYRDVFASVREGKPVPIKPESVRRQIAVLEECHRQCPRDKRF
jgi:predicted dehydrogenase